MQNHIQANKYYAIVQEGIWLSSEKTDVIQNNLIYLEKCCSNKLGMDLMIYKVCSRVEVKDGRRGSCQYQPFPCMSPPPPTPTHIIPESSKGLGLENFYLVV